MAHICSSSHPAEVAAPALHHIVTERNLILRNRFVGGGRGTAAGMGAESHRTLVEPYSYKQPELHNQVKYLQIYHIDLVRHCITIKTLDEVFKDYTHLHIVFSLPLICLLFWYFTSNWMVEWQWRMGQVFVVLSIYSLKWLKHVR